MATIIDFVRLVEEVVGRGPDHEPLIGEFRPLAWLDGAVVDQERDHYYERFDVGRSGPYPPRTCPRVPRGMPPQ